MSAPLPGGAVLWGKTGHDDGYANGMFATRDLSICAVYSVCRHPVAEAPLVKPLSTAFWCFNAGRARPPRGRCVIRLASPHLTQLR
ncbi:hypothetical protein [Kitasatospora aureofaciens]|uniref:hypothetical protein n=1 Tax=Kitasatospora aureofaciens TaxID=1894 RepID=UPI001C460EE6|nr:hypothetical protein [Kitasatospora aureofaciens]MBV6701702.1 hypothetical protein [Kitasatospora aureofaciens]